MVKKLLYIFSFLLLSSSAVAERSVSSDEYLSFMDVPLTLKACQSSNYYRQCFDVTASQCEETYMSAIRLCADKERREVPEVIPSREEAGQIGAKVLICANRGYQAVHGPKKKSLAQCKNVAAWNEHIKAASNLERTETKIKELNQEWLNSCEFKQGDHYSKVKGFYGLDNEPRSKSTSSSGNKYFYHLDEYGVWFFFDNDRNLTLIRFDSPFSGKIKGVSVGDAKSHVRSLKGTPSKTFKGMPDLESKHMKIHKVSTEMKDASSPESIALKNAMIAKINSGVNPIMSYTEGWIFGSGVEQWVRYDVSNIANKVQYIFSKTCK